MPYINDFLKILKKIVIYVFSLMMLYNGWYMLSLKKSISIIIFNRGFEKIWA